MSDLKPQVLISYFLILIIFGEFADDYLLMFALLEYKQVLFACFILHFRGMFGH